MTLMAEWMTTFYERKIRECREEAKSTLDPERAAHWNNLAQEWEELSILDAEVLTMPYGVRFRVR
jgi:hypothetical protein